MCDFDVPDTGIDDAAIIFVGCYLRPTLDPLLSRYYEYFFILVEKKRSHSHIRLLTRS